MKTINRFFDDIHAIRLWLESGPITVQLPAEDRNALLDAFVNFRRRKPKAVKES